MGLGRPHAPVDHAQRRRRPAGGGHPAPHRVRGVRLRAYRLTKRVYASTAFDGEGSRRVGGRWSSRGRRVVYLSEHRSLAALEVLVHVPRVQLLRDRYAMIPVEIPEELVEDLDPATLPSGWNDPVDLRTTQRIGDRWLEERASAALRVPSAVVRGERNLLLAPDHPGAGRIDIAEPEAFLFDARLAR